MPAGHQGAHPTRYPASPAFSPVPNFGDGGDRAGRKRCRGGCHHPPHQPWVNTAVVERGARSRFGRPIYAATEPGGVV